MKRRNEILETLKLAAQIQHQTAQDRGEIECTETTPCIFCHAVGEMVPPPPPPPDSWVAAPAVITETLSDGSQVYDVKYTLDGGGEIMFGCNSKQAAEELKDILTSEVVWITVD
jgi:hypothetical protein